MGDIVLAGSTSGTTTLTPTAVSGTTTLTLPATTGTVALTASPTFTGQATIPTINLTGGQITFPATQSASADANTLDDYEEGTWTPTLGGTTTYSAQAGQYTKIGRMVFLSGVIIVTVIGTGSTTAITGLPFTDGNIGGFKGGSVNHFSTIATSVVNIIPQIGAGSAQIDLKSLTAAATGVGSSAIFGSGARVDFQCSYFI